MSGVGFGNHARTPGSGYPLKPQEGELGVCLGPLERDRISYSYVEFSVGKRFSTNNIFTALIIIFTYKDPVLMENLSLFYVICLKKQTNGWMEGWMETDS